MRLTFNCVLSVALKGKERPRIAQGASLGQTLTPWGTGKLSWAVLATAGRPLFRNVAFTQAETKDRTGSDWMVI